MALNKQIILRQALSGNQKTINITNSNYIDIIKEEISKINNINVYNLIINKDIYLCFELEKIKYDDISEIASPREGYYAREIPSPQREGYYAREIQIIDIVFLSYKLVDIINLLDNKIHEYEQDIIYNLDNINLIIYLITQKSFIFKYLSDEFKNNYKIVELAIQKDKFAFKYASNELKNNFEIVKLAIINKNFSVLKYASNELKNNFEIVSIAVQKHGNSLQYASNELRLEKAKLFPNVIALRKNL